MKSKSRKVLLTISLVTAGLLIFWLLPKSIYGTYHINKNDISKIEFLDLRNESHITTINDRDKINDFLKYIDEFKVTAPRPSFFESNDINVINFYSNDKLLLTMCPTSTTTLRINGRKYLMYKDGLSYEIIDKTLSSRIVAEFTNSK